MSAREHDFPIAKHRIVPTVRSCLCTPRRTHAGVSRREHSNPDRCLASAPPSGQLYFEVGAELEGDLTAGPLLLPGNPGTLAAS